MVSTLGPAAGLLFSGGTICAAAAVATDEDSSSASATRRIGELLELKADHRPLTGIRAQATMQDRMFADSSLHFVERRGVVSGHSLRRSNVAPMTSRSTRLGRAALLFRASA